MKCDFFTLCLLLTQPVLYHCTKIPNYTIFLTVFPNFHGYFCLPLPPCASRLLVLISLSLRRLSSCKVCSKVFFIYGLTLSTTFAHSSFLSCQQLPVQQTKINYTLLSLSWMSKRIKKFSVSFTF